MVERGKQGAPIAEDSPLSLGCHRGLERGGPAGLAPSSEPGLPGGRPPRPAPSRRPFPATAASGSRPPLPRGRMGPGPLGRRSPHTSSPPKRASSSSVKSRTGGPRSAGRGVCPAWTADSSGSSATTRASAASGHSLRPGAGPAIVSAPSTARAAWAAGPARSSPQPGTPPRARPPPRGPRAGARRDRAAGNLN